jgi:site-specific DNA-methyltransferase (adenine-specific)
VTPYYEDESVTIYHGDCRDIAPTLTWDSVVTDPPWGNNTRTNAQRFTRETSPWFSVVDTSKVVAHRPVHGDTERFDPTPWVDRPAILWGANHFADRLPVSGGWLVWDKCKGLEPAAVAAWPLGEGELAWTNVTGAVRVFRNLWRGLLRQAEKGEFYHPAQKPVALMSWCLGWIKSPGVVLDPYMGSGSTLRAVKDEQLIRGVRAIGIEIEERYCEIAAKRMGQEVLALS